MATISNPATFSSVRTAFNTEGYGLSTSFYAYRQGGGIVPATSTFNIIGAGTAGDPLRLTQFNGFVVPSLTLDTQTVTVGSATVGGFPGDTYVEKGFYSGYYGSVSDGTSNVAGGGTIYGIWDRFIYSGPGTQGFFFGVNGSRANSGWSTITIGASSFSRTAATYTNGGTYTVWSWGSPLPFAFTYGDGEVVSVVFT